MVELNGGPSVVGPRSGTLFPSPSQRETDAGLRNDIEVTAMTLCYVAQTFRITAQPANLY